jgi:hypothetical protein
VVDPPHPLMHRSGGNARIAFILIDGRFADGSAAEPGLGALPGAAGLTLP